MLAANPINPSANIFFMVARRIQRMLGYRLKWFVSRRHGGCLSWCDKRCDRALSPLRAAGAYLTEAGTGMTNLPSFIATKLSLVLEDVLSPSFLSTAIFNFLVGLSGNCILPPGPS